MRPSSSAVLRGYRAQLNKIFYFFSGAYDMEKERNAAKAKLKETRSSRIRRRRGSIVTVHEAGAAAETATSLCRLSQGRSNSLYERFCANGSGPNDLPMIDQPMTFSQLTHMLKVCGLLGPGLPPRLVASLWTEVTNVSDVESIDTTSSARPEICRCEFNEILLAVRRRTCKKTDFQVSEGSESGLDRWFKDVFFPAANQAMPMRGDTFSRSTERKDHYLSNEFAQLKEAMRRLSQVPVFRAAAATDDKFVEIVGKALEPRTYEDKQPIIRKGETGTEMYFIVEGDCEVCVDGEQLAHICQGDFFGETALLCDAPRNADVFALGHVELFVLTKTDLLKAVSAFPELASKLWESMRPGQRASAGHGVAVSGK